MRLLNFLLPGIDTLSSFMNRLPQASLELWTLDHLRLRLFLVLALAKEESCEDETALTLLSSHRLFLFHALNALSKL